jgi:DNA-binding MarR family transcriptional regulator
MKEAYFELVMLLERLHRLFLEICKIELIRLNVQDISSIQALILYNINKNQISVGEISNRGYYLGSNVSYNLKKMIENDYIFQQQALHDKRSNQIRLSPKGLKLLESLDVLLQKQVHNLQFNGLRSADLRKFLEKAHHLESFWASMLSQDARF